MPEHGVSVPVEILMIEDNEDDVALVRAYLPDDGYVVTWCSTARRAKETLRERSFDVILLDHGLPDSNALSFLEQLRDQYPGCPVIILTGREDRALAIAAREKGALSYLLKDEIADHLLSTLRQAEELVTSRTDSIRSDPGPGDADEGAAPHFIDTVGSGPRFIDTAEQYYRVLLETMHDGCLVVDHDGIITVANPAAAAMLRVTSRRLLGRNAIEFFTAGSADRLREALDEMRGRPDVREAPFEAELAPDRVVGGSAGIAVRISIRGLQRAGGAFESALLILTDISEQVRAREMREDLVRTTIHDLRNPLSVIVATLESAMDDVTQPVEEDLAEAIDLALASAYKMRGLVNDLLAIGRLESGKLELSRQDVDLAVLIEQAIQGQKPLAEGCGAHLRAVTSEHIASIDATMIARVLQNLIDNAIAAVPDGGHVTVRCGDVGLAGIPEPAPELFGDLHDVASYCVAVTDDGPGIKPELIDRVFEKFVSASLGGSGLGLAFCKLAVEAHGGRIWFDSEPGRGTTFYFTVPAAGS